MIVTAYFGNLGTPATGLSPTVDIRAISTGTLTVNDGAMTEVGNGFYKYTFSAYNTDEEYLLVADGGATLSGAERYAIGSITDVAGDVETDMTHQEAMRLCLAAAAGKLTGASAAATATITIRDVNDTSSRIIADVDQYGNRNAITVDVT